MHDLEIVEPPSFCVLQRSGFAPAHAHENAQGGPELGYADVRVVCRIARPRPNLALRVRLVPQPGNAGEKTDWRSIPIERHRQNVATTVLVRSGWYGIQAELRDGIRLVASETAGPVGIGEVFLVAGQSYAAGCNDELMRVDDHAGRVTACNFVRRTWQVADDPQPCAGDGGTIWPPMANALLPFLRVPIGFVNAAVGGTSSREWRPGGPFFQRLVRAGRAAGRFRCVLWQQGESDVIEKVSVATYLRNIVTIRTTLARQLGFDPPWLLAKSTLHPTVYNDPIQENVIRSAIDCLYRLPGFRQGPDTDILGGENRGDMNSRRHFTGIGQRRAGLLWFAAVWSMLMEEWR